MRGDGDEDLAAGRQALAHRGERGDIVLDMLDHVEHRDQIVMMPGHIGQDRQRRGADRLAEPLRRDRARGGIDLDRIHRAELREHRQIMPGAAADLEDLGARRERPLAGQEIGQDVAPRAIPPMRRIMLGHAIIDAAVHLRKKPTAG